MRSIRRDALDAYFAWTEAGVSSLANLAKVFNDKALSVLLLARSKLGRPVSRLWTSVSSRCPRRPTGMVASRSGQHGGRGRATVRVRDVNLPRSVAEGSSGRGRVGRMAKNEQLSRGRKTV